jgi:hypothetical protein
LLSGSVEGASKGASATNTTTQGDAAGEIVVLDTAAHHAREATQDCSVLLFSPNSSPFMLDQNNQMPTTTPLQPLAVIPGAKQSVQEKEIQPTRLPQNGPVTPIRVDRLQYWLRGYDSDKQLMLVMGFKDGFRIEYTGAPNSSSVANLKSANENPQVFREYLMKEQQAGRIVGPFDHPPFQQFQMSPVGVVPKKEPGVFWVIHHLSFPQGTSINDFISPECTTVTYATVENAISLVKEAGPGSFMAKTDIKKAFRTMPVHPSEHHLFLVIRTRLLSTT